MVCSVLGLAYRLANHFIETKAFTTPETDTPCTSSRCGAGVGLPQPLFICRRTGLAFDLGLRRLARSSRRPCGQSIP
ncbi:hypothetical protein PMIT1342_02185 [Prochlorococcus marinus str. MIT 1342]|nr:hypothetical protein PMIT1342_02185 [Prochlorococcus marinus str. MIT 1342]